LVHLGVETPIEVIPNGVDIQPFDQVEQPIPRQKFGFKQDDILLTYMGRLGVEKNLPFLLRSFGGIANTYENVGLLVIGGGSECENLEERVRLMGLAERVHFTGMVPYDDLPAYMAAADAFVTASVSEVHPLSVIEALASGLPVVGIQSPGVGDIVKDGVTGYLASEEDLAEFTAKLSRIVTDSGSREKMSHNAKQAAKMYAIENTTAIILEHYQELLEEFAGRKAGIISRIIRPFKRIRN
jgi:1,2-diacylglycerol 3-alpha-glucosyltransferase